MKLKYVIKEESYKLRCGVDGCSRDIGEFEKKDIKLAVAKRDWAAFQIFATADEDFTLSLGNNAFFSPQGPLNNIRIKIELEEKSGLEPKMQHEGLIEDDDRIYKTDLLLNDETVHVKKNFIHGVWVEINVPYRVKAGIRKGRVVFYQHSMFEDEKIVGVIEFSIDVKDVVLPKPEQFKFHLDLWQHLSNIARKHEVILWSDEHFNVLERYVESLGALGQKAVTVIASEIPWSGQGSFNVTNYLSDLFEYSMVKVKRKVNGEFVYDFSVIERYINLCFKYGINREIEVFGLTGIWEIQDKGYGKIAEDYPDAIRIRFLDEADGCYKFIKSGEEIKKYIMALEKYFINRGIIDKVRIVADEPADVDLYRERLNLISSIAPNFKFKTAINHAEFIEEFKHKVTDFVPILSSVCEKWELINQLKEDVNGRLLWYVCCWPPVPNTFIRSHLLESRFIGLFTAYLGLHGFLRWNYTVWPENPREKISYRYPTWSAGDTNFVYPAKNGSPLLTLRYKNLKRGIEEYELIQRLKEIHPEAESLLEKIWSIIIKTKEVGDFDPASNKPVGELLSLNYRDYDEARELILSELQKCNDF
jgi:hypothetical protein